ncbi:glycosyltransferase family protein [Maricaulis sp. CAU 1757]
MLIGVLMPDPGALYKYGFLARLMDARVEAWRQAGHDVLELRRTDTRFFNKLAKLCDAKSAVLFLGYAFNLALSHRQAEPVNVSDIVDCPVFGMIGDHPFAHFLVEDIVGLSSSLRLFGREPGYEIAHKFLRPGGPDLVPLTGLPVGEVADTGAANLNEDRDIDVLVPMDLRSGVPDAEFIGSEAEKIGFPRPLSKRLIAALKDEYEVYPWTIFAEIVEDSFGVPLTQLARSDKQRVALAKCLNLIDLRIRADRRQSMVRRLAGCDPGLRIAILDEPTGRSLAPSNIEYLGKRDAQEYFRLLARTKVTLFVHPTYPGMINGRVVNALSAGSSVVCDPNPCLENRFGPDDGVFVVDQGTDLGEVVQVAMAASVAGVEAGQRKVSAEIASASLEGQMLTHFHRSVL